jgi:hypothetical protein
MATLIIVFAAGYLSAGLVRWLRSEWRNWRRDRLSFR